MFSSPAFNAAVTRSPVVRCPVEHQWAMSGAPLRVREWRYRYEDEGSEGLSRGAVTVEQGGWWSISLSVPAAERTDRTAVALLQLVRHGGTPQGHGISTDAEMVLPAAELDAVVALLAGVVAQARRDGVLAGSWLREGRS